MKGLKAVFNFYINASIHIAFAVLSLLLATGVFFSMKIDIHLASFVFFSTICCYNFIKYGVEAKKYVLVTTRYFKNIQLISILALLVSSYSVFFLSWGAIFCCVVLVVLTGIYALPVLPKSKNFRDFGGLKIIPVALVWSGLTVVVPILNLELPMTWDLMIEAIQRFILVLILLMPFEIRDLKYDPPELKTLPQRFGVKKSKYFGFIAVVICLGLTYLKDVISLLEVVSKVILFLVLGVVLLLTTNKQTKYFASFWVEAIPILWLGIIYIMQLYIRA